MGFRMVIEPTYRPDPVLREHRHDSQLQDRERVCVTVTVKVPVR